MRSESQATWRAAFGSVSSVYSCHSSVRFAVACAISSFTERRRWSCRLVDLESIGPSDRTPTLGGSNKDRTGISGGERGCYEMGVGVSLILIAAGAVLAWA